MPCFDIIKETRASHSFKVEQVKAGFDLQTDRIMERFTGDIAIEGKEWHIGLIVGRSGTGKTTIAKEIFPESYLPPHEYSNEAIIDEMPGEYSYKEISQIFTAVGFSSPPSWLKPYSVLSNGERMRVDLAYALLSGKDPILFDEFTSVVDREIAKVCSYAISKTIRKLGKKFIAVSCHEDIIEWLEPDWIYDTNSQTFTFRGHTRTRPEIKLDVIKVEDKTDAWSIFRKYHYLNHDINRATACYIGMIGEKPVVFCGIIQFPHPINKKIRRVTRLVVLPDYQGVGIGIRFLNFIAAIYKKAGYDVRLVTSQMNVLYALSSKGWILLHKGHKSVSKNGVESLRKRTSNRRITGSFKYVGGPMT